MNSIECSIINNGIGISTTANIVKPLTHVDIGLHIDVSWDGGKTFSKNILTAKRNLCKFLENPLSNYLLNMLYVEMVSKGANYLKQKCPLKPVIIIYKIIKSKKKHFFN